MTERAYTLDEIDRMRAAVGVLARNTGAIWSHRDDENAVEGRLRTYMSAGIEPEELESKAKKIADMLMAILKAETLAKMAPRERELWEKVWNAKD